MSKSQGAPKIGQGHANAMLRSGFKELGQIFPSGKDAIQPVEEMGLFGNALPQEIFEEKKSQAPNIERNLEMEM